MNPKIEVLKPVSFEEYKKTFGGYFDNDEQIRKSYEDANPKHKQEPEDVKRTEKTVAVENKK